MKVTQAEIVEVIGMLLKRVMDLQGHGVVSSMPFHIVERIQQHGIAVDYVPMTDDELTGAYLSVHTSIEDGFRNIEQAVLNRLGVAPVVKESLITELDQARAICEQAGFAVVPKEPTPKMCVAGFLVSEAEHDPAGVYLAMLEAAKEVK